MNLLHLHYFHVVAREGGFTKASKLLRIQQPAISRMVRQLEESFGFALFERVGREVRLTPRGREIYEGSRRVFEEVDTLRARAGNLEAAPKGALAFGAAEGIASHFVPPVLAKLLKKYPEIYPQLYSGAASDIFPRIANGELEFGLFFHIPALPPTLRLEILGKIRFHLVIRKDLRKNRETLAAFIGSREIDDTSTKTFPTLTKLKDRIPEASIKISSNNLTAHKSLVLEGAGVAVLPDFIIGEDLKRGALVDVLPKETLEFDLKLIERKKASRGTAARSLIEEMGW